MLLRSHGYEGPFNLDYKPPRTTSTHGVFAVSFPTAVDRFITLWEMAGEVMSDAIIKEATDALKAGGGYSGDPHDADAIVAACREIRAGKHHEHFRVDMIQGGAGTSTNMNAN